MLPLAQAAKILQVHPDSLRRHVTNSKLIPGLPALTASNTGKGAHRPRWSVDLPEELRPPKGLWSWQVAKRRKIDSRSASNKIRRGRTSAIKWGGRWIITEPIS